MSSGNPAVVFLTEDGATLLQYAVDMLVQYAIKLPIAFCFRSLFADGTNNTVFLFL